MTGSSASEPARDMIGRVIVINGAPCSGKTSTARAFQAHALDRGQTWLHVPLDVFDAMLPRGQVPIGDVLTLLRDTNTVISILATGSNVVLEVVAREDNPAASTALLGILHALRAHDVVVVYLHCSRDTALDRERRRPHVMQGLVERDYGRVDASSHDVAIDTDENTPSQAAGLVATALEGTTRGGRDRLVKRLRHEARRFEG